MIEEINCSCNFRPIKNLLEIKNVVRTVLGEVIGGRVIKEKFDAALVLHRFDSGKRNSQRIIRKLRPPR